MMRKQLVILLTIISACVFIGVLVGANMWLLISLYWLVLTIKNALDVKEEVKK